MVMAQNNLETGHRKNMWNYNVGNITTDGKGSHDFFDDLSTNEQIQSGVWKKMNLKYRAYPSLEDGTKDYLKLLSGSHYAQAWQHILHPDPIAFSHALKAGGYYTGNEEPYTKTLTSLFNQSAKSGNYELAMSDKVPPPSQIIAQPPSQTTGWEASLENIMNKFLGMLSSTSDYSLKQLYKTSLPTHDILIKITAPDHTSGVEFSRVLCAALDEDLLATTYPHSDGQEVEIECSIQGPAAECFAAVEQMAEAVAEIFRDATKKIGGITVKTECSMNKKSSYQSISLRTAGTNYRKFLLKFV